MNETLSEAAAEYFISLQNQICSEVTDTDGKATFIQDLWDRPESEEVHGGGGDTRILREGAVFEQAGVNFSKVTGMLPASMTKILLDADQALPFFATGVSLVFHPYSPLVPTTHANVRYLNVGDRQWFGGGMDLTPYYLNDQDAVHFHTQLKDCCDRHDLEYYPRFKKACDEYFFLPNRLEARGIGGIFFDYLGRDTNQDLDQIFEFVQDVGNSLMSAYLPIVQRHRNTEWTKEQKQFQLVRRGRYVEFNLLYDRGTKFGLETKGRTESILMSLPPQVHWEYCAKYPEDSEEAKLIAVLQSPRAWV